MSRCRIKGWGLIIIMFVYVFNDIVNIFSTIRMFISSRAPI